MKDYKKSGKINGELVIDGNLILTGNLEVEEYISVTGYIDCAGYSIKAGDSIKAGYYIEAGGFIKAGGFIEADGWIKTGDSYGIQAGLLITCKGTLSFGTKAFAGINTWRAITDEEKTITCSKLIGGGVVEYGILKETGEPEVEEMTLSEICKKLGRTVKIVNE